MDILLNYTTPDISQPKDLAFRLPLSKSLEARHLMLRAIGGASSQDSVAPDNELPQDIKALQTALYSASIGDKHINVGESGTAMRMMLAYLAATAQSNTVLEGEARQHERPIAPLVDALKSLGANIAYLQKEGYPSLLISPSQLVAREVILDASISSQYLSALLLIAPLVEGTNYAIDTRSRGIASRPYAEMTRALMLEYNYLWQEQEGLYHYLGKATKPTQAISPRSEADWSAASYAYMLLCLGQREVQQASLSLRLDGLEIDSLQGDSTLLPTLFETLGVYTQNLNHSIRLGLQTRETTDLITLNCQDTPDLVPALTASFIAQQQAFRLNGIAHLRHKESDRLAVLQQELRKVGINLGVTNDSLFWDGYHDTGIINADNPIHLDPHQDHRIAMALAPLMAKLLPQGVVVLNADSVEKSFPHYWAEITKLGYTSNILS